MEQWKLEKELPRRLLMIVVKKNRIGAGFP